MKFRIEIHIEQFAEVKSVLAAIDAHYRAALLVYTAAVLAAGALGLWIALG